MAMVLGNRHAASLGQSQMGTEHFLLAVFDLPSSPVRDRVAVDALRSLGISQKRAIAALKSERVPVEGDPPTGAVPMTDELKRALGSTIQRWPGTYVGPEHVLLTIVEQPETPVGELVAEPQGGAAELMDALGVSRQRVVETLREIVDRERPTPPTHSTVRITAARLRELLSLRAEVCGSLRRQQGGLPGPSLPDAKAQAWQVQAVHHRDERCRAKVKAAVLTLQDRATVARTLQ